MNLSDTISLLPNKPGVYKFKDKSGNIIYIGKAINLKSRVSSYFSNNHDDRPRIIQMLDLIDSIEVTQTENEIEALVLESALVRDIQPKFNTELKDDKSYAWLYINTQDDYPTVKIVRTVKREEYRKGRLFGPYPNGRAVSQVFKYIRKLYPFCTSKDPRKACFHYYIGLCPGPDATKEQYRNNIEGIIKFLSGSKKTHIKKLEKEMLELASKQEFERAALLRDKIQDLKYLGQKINFNYFNTEQDYITARQERIKQSLADLADEIGAKTLQRIECYDISNIQGQLSYGSMVVGIDGIPVNSQYRVFKIKEVDGPNDPLMLKEVLTRRIKNINRSPDESLSQTPDLILIDGGKTQLKAVSSVIPKHIMVLGITKGRRFERKGMRKKDEFWVMRAGIVFNLSLKNTQILATLRDESHRFALLHHRKLRKFVQKKSILDEIQGIGPKRKRELIKAFGSVAGIKKATLDEIKLVIKNESTAKKLKEELSKANNQ